MVWWMSQAPMGAGPTTQRSRMLSWGFLEPRALVLLPPQQGQGVQLTLAVRAPRNHNICILQDGFQKLWNNK